MNYDAQDMARKVIFPRDEMFQKYFELLIDGYIKTGKTTSFEKIAKKLGCTKNTIKTILSYYHNQNIQPKVDLKIINEKNETG